MIIVKLFTYKQRLADIPAGQLQLSVFFMVFLLGAVVPAGYFSLLI